MHDFDLYVFELLKFAVHTNRESHLPNIKTLFLHKSSTAFTRSVCFKVIHTTEERTEVNRQSLKYRGTLKLSHLLKTKMLPRSYESIRGK